jgi:eukaryotic-like serine/threonine-protein kinase
MTPEQWRRATEIFHHTLALAPEERANYLATGCESDDALRAEVEAMLDAHEHALSFGDVPIVMSNETRSLPLGASFGPYRIEARLGAGGMGEVYRARDTTLGRNVAIKVLSPQFATDPARLAASSVRLACWHH